MPPGEQHTVTISGAMSGWGVFITPDIDHGLPHRPCVIGVSELTRALIRRASSWTWHERLNDEQERLMAVLLDEMRRAPHESLYLPMPLDRRLMRIAQAILEQPHDNRSLDDWAAWAGLSARSLSRLFRAETALSFAQWRQQARLSRGLEQLAEGTPVAASPTRWAMSVSAMRKLPLAAALAALLLSSVAIAADKKDDKAKPDAKPDAACCSRRRRERGFGVGRRSQHQLQGGGRHAGAARQRRQGERAAGQHVLRRLHEEGRGAGQAADHLHLQRRSRFGHGVAAHGRVRSEAGGDRRRQHTPAAPYGLVNNDYSLLDATDVVFIDAPGAGFSRLIAADDDKSKRDEQMKDRRKAIYSVDGDGHAFAQFITQFLSKYGRWNSPKYLFGESYGTTRSAVLANILENENSVDLNGVILLSQILNFDTSIDGPQFNPGIDLPYELALAHVRRHGVLSPQAAAATGGAGAVPRRSEAVRAGRLRAGDDGRFALERRAKTGRGGEAAPVHRPAGRLFAEGESARQRRHVRA
jgi:AraC-like DNA-binding protein